MEKIKVAYFSNQTIITAVEHLRLFGPISYTDIKILLWSKNNLDLFTCINESNLIIIQRNFPENYDVFSKILEISRTLKKPLVYDLDDNLFVLPENHQDRKTFFYSKALMPMLEAALTADYITVSTNYLRQSLINLNKNIFVLPNYLDEKIWRLYPPKKQVSEDVRFLGYMGGNTHTPDLQYVAPILFELKKELKERIHFVFYGVKPPDILLSFPDTRWIPIKTHNYREFIKDFQKINVDFFIAPLVDNEFNNCKSPIKYLEYSTLGVPGIFSDVYSYKEIITDGKNGLLASTPEEWREKILLLIGNPEICYSLAKNAQNQIKENFLMSQNSKQWKSTYQSIISTGIAEKNESDFPPVSIKTITRQLHEYHDHISTQLDEKKINIKDLEQNNQTLQNEIKAANQKIESLNNEINAANQKIESLNQEVQDLEQEVLYYALSKSWHVTRPLRKIKKILQGK